MIEFQLEDGTTKFVPLGQVDQFMKDFPGAKQIGGSSEEMVEGNIGDFSTETQTMESGGMDLGSGDGSSGSVQDRTVQPNIVIPEIDPNAPLNSEDFYLKDSLIVSI